MKEVHNEIVVVEYRDLIMMKHCQWRRRNKRLTGFTINIDAERSLIFAIRTGSSSMLILSYLFFLQMSAAGTTVTEKRIKKKNSERRLRDSDQKVMFPNLSNFRLQESAKKLA